jgi:hypothetical protein
MHGGQLEAAWAILREALPDGWRVNEPLYDPDRQGWSVWAVPRPPIRVLPIRGSGASAASSRWHQSHYTADRCGASRQRVSGDGWGCRPT